MMVWVDLRILSWAAGTPSRWPSGMPTWLRPTSTQRSSAWWPARWHISRA